MPGNTRSCELDRGDGQMPTLQAGRIIEIQGQRVGHRLICTIEAQNDGRSIGDIRTIDTRIRNRSI